MRAFALLPVNLFRQFTPNTNSTRFFGGSDLLSYSDLHKAQNFSIRRACGIFGGLSFFDTQPYESSNAHLF
jgi:hypothetical protein